MSGAFSPEQVVTLGKALDELVEKYGPFSDDEKRIMAERLIRLAEDGILDIDRLVEMARPHKAPTAGTPAPSP